MGTKAIKIDIAKLESSLRARMSPEQTFGAFESCIFKTPEILKRHKPEAYTPDAFSIGPMHHGDPNLADAEKIKSLYLRDFLNRSSTTTPFTLTTVIEAVENLEADARACYAEDVNFTREKLVEILVLDGCFLIELLYRSGSGHDPDTHPNDPVRTKACMLQFLYHDLVLLENQIPWIVLNGLFNATVKEGPNKSTLKTLVVCFFAHHFSATNPLREPSDPGYECKHVLDLIRESLIAPFHVDKDRTKKWKRTPSAITQSEAGVKLVRMEKQNSILDVKFDNGRLEIPHVLIMETTEATFRNLISYEQCYPGCKPIVTSYVILMDNLVDRSEDLDEMCEEGIVENWLDPEEATKLFNSLYSDANVTDFYYYKLSDDVNAYCKGLWPRFKGWYRHNYFTKPWAILAQVAAVIGLILTVVQTVFAIPAPGPKPH